MKKELENRLGGADDRECPHCHKQIPTEIRQFSDGSAPCPECGKDVNKDPEEE